MSVAGTGDNAWPSPSAPPGSCTLLLCRIIGNRADSDNALLTSPGSLRGLRLTWLDSRPVVGSIIRLASIVFGRD